jgi:hypothetical protein
MKKFLVVLLSLGLIVAFAATVSAQPTVKFGGSYYVAGVYQDNPNVTDDVRRNSRAFFQQRVRIQPVFQIAEGLTFTARVDALEKKWGDAEWRRAGALGGQDTTSSRPVVQTAGTAANAQQNFEFERGFVTFLTGIGQFQVGYQSADEWGTAFGDNGTTRPRFVYATKLGPVQLLAIYEKFYEAERSAAAAGRVNADFDTYALAGIYNQKGIEAGLLYKYYLNNSTLVLAAPNTGSQKFTLIAPYMKATFGPVFVEGELNYFFGKAFESKVAGVSDIDMRAYGAYLHAKMNLGPAYVGAQFALASGDDGSDVTKSKTSIAGAGSSWNTTLILNADDLLNWSASTGSANNGKLNTVNYNLYAGFLPTPKLDIKTSLTYARAHKVAATAVNKEKELGLELDVTATYKIYNNLSYMIGAGYLWTGDRFKGNAGTTPIGNDYILVNQLTLSF